MEHSSNSILVVLAGVGTPFVVGFAGMLDETPGYADGPVAFARFNFTDPGDLCPTGDERILIADTGNHRVRELENNGFGGFNALTVAGTGIAASVDGDLFIASFDTPSGVAVTCMDELVVTERGTAGFGGNLLRSLTRSTDFFTGLSQVSATTLAGDGTEMTAEGEGVDAALADPSSPVVTASDEVYWVDQQTGVLRRYDFATRESDCPLAADCASALGSTPFTAGGEFSLTVSAQGALYVLDATAGTLWRIP